MARPTRPSPEREYSPGIRVILAIPYVLPALFGLMWVGAQLGKVASLPTIAVYLSMGAAVPMFVFAVVQMVLFHIAYDNDKGVWFNSWIAIEGAGVADVVFTIAWMYRSSSSHFVLVTGAILMVVGWVLYGYQRAATGDILADTPHVPYIAMATLGGLVGGAGSWFLEHPSIPTALAQAAQPQPAYDPASSAVITGPHIQAFFTALGVVTFVILVIWLLKRLHIIK